jgi:folate-dependent tRNA-U54 methylase TrmFO/GidA
MDIGEKMTDEEYTNFLRKLIIELKLLKIQFHRAILLNEIETLEEIERKIEKTMRFYC